MTDIPLHSGPEPDEVTRSLPHAVGPEKSVLSSILQEPLKFIPEALEAGLREDHFYLPAHQILFRELVGLSDAGEEIELVALIQKLLDRGQLDRIGGTATLTDIYTYAPSPGHFRRHLALLKEKRTLRGLIQLSQTTIAGAYDDPESGSQLLEQMDASITDLREGQVRTRGIVSAKEGAREALQRLEDIVKGKEGVRGLTTGFADLDRMGGTLRPGEMFVVAARPSMGKTSWLLNVVEHVAVDLCKPSLVFSCEMPQQAVFDRLIYSRAKFAMSMLSPGHTFAKGDLQRIQRAMAEISAAPLFIDDTGAITITELRAKARRKKREEDIQFIAIDYLQLMRSVSKQANNSREREIGEISAGLKALAKELNVPVVVLAQLNRASENRGGSQRGVPRMSDLRESGSIEQDADLIGLLHRSAYFADSDEERAQMAGQAKLILAKNRNGATGDVPLTFIAELMRFETGEPVRDEQVEMFAGNRPKSRFND